MGKKHEEYQMRRRLQSLKLKRAYSEKPSSEHLEAVDDERRSQGITLSMLKRSVVIT
uniref:Uncharacterized protein n=1 Tax=Moniliophthora roreri TaxID=221103 RepID=A0A0W0FND4_MONRR